MPDSISAVSSNSNKEKDISSTISLYNFSTYEGNGLNNMISDNISTTAFHESDFNDDDHIPTISRPLSRSSVTSGLSMTATKDGIEGRQIQRYGIPQYSLNLLNSMVVQSKWKKHATSHKEDMMNLSSGPPMALWEKMKLLNNERLHLSKTSQPIHHGCSTSCESLSLEGEQLSSIKPSILYDTYQRSNSIITPHDNSELESNSSTIGDDISYLRDIRSLPSVPSMADIDGIVNE